MIDGNAEFSEVASVPRPVVPCFSRCRPSTPWNPAWAESNYDFRIFQMSIMEPILFINFVMKWLFWVVWEYIYLDYKEKGMSSRGNLLSGKCELYRAFHQYRGHTSLKMF